MNFFDILFKPQFVRRSDEAERLLLRLAEVSGDQTLLEWMRENRAFSYFSLAPGYTERLNNGRIWIGLNRVLLNHPNSPTTIFIASHELGHVRQFLAGQSEQPRGTWKLYRQELDASEFAAQVIPKANRFGLPSRFRLKAYRRLLALEATFPLRTLFLGTFLIALLAYILSCVWSWVLDKLLAKSNGLGVRVLARSAYETLS